MAFSDNVSTDDLRQVRRRGQWQSLKHKKEELAAMAGGDADVLELIMPVLESFCETIYHVGERGTGTTIKLANNYFFAVNSAVVCGALLMDGRPVSTTRRSSTSP